MKDLENNNILELQKKDYIDKINKYNLKINDLLQQLTIEKEQAKSLNKDLTELTEQIQFYQFQLPNKNLDKYENSDLFDNSYINSDNDNILIQEEEDQLLVYQILKNRLEEISKNLDLVEKYPEKKEIYNNESLTFQCICILFFETIKVIDKNVEKNNIFIRYQTFRITQNTRIDEILDTAFNLWDQPEKKNDYNFINLNDNTKINDYSLKINDLLKKSKTQIKEAKFLLYPKNKTIDFENEYEEEHEKEIIKYLNNDDLIFNFSKNIVGLSKHIRNKYKIIQEKENIEEENNDYQETIDFNYYIHIFVNFILFLLFFIFTIVSLVSMNNVNKTFYDIQTIKKLLKLNNTNNYLYNSEMIIDKIKDLLHPFFYNKINETNQIPSANTYKLISNARFVFYGSYNIPCNDYLQSYIDKKLNNSELNCYNNYYKSYDDLKGIFINKYSLLLKEIKFINDSNNNKYLIYSNDDNNEKEKKNQYISEFLEEFEGDDNNLEGALSIKGDIGYYKENNNINLFIPLNYISDEIINIIFNNLYSFIHVSKIKAIIIDFTLYNYNSNLYYYIYFLIELNQNSGTLPIKYEIKPFHSNLKKMENGKGIKIIDIFRLIFAIILFLNTLLGIYFNHFKEKSNTELNKEKKDNRKETLLDTILSLRTLIDIFLFTFMIISFSIKNNNLYQNLSKNEDTALSKDNLTDYKFLKNIEYYKISHSFELSIIYDSILLILCFLRILIFFSNFELIRPIYMYIRNSFYRAIPFLFIYIILILIFALYGYFLYGLEYDSYSKYSKSFLSCLQLSIYHFKNIHNPNSIFIMFESVFIFLFSVLIIFFIGNSFFGMYLDTYRINSLKYNNMYNIKKMLLEKNIFKKISNEDKENKNNYYEEII
jgi:hypothetical protein